MPHRTAILLALCLWPSATAADQGDLRVLHADLRLERAALVELDDANAVLRRPDGRTERVALGALLGLSAGARPGLPEIQGITTPPNRLFIELTDAQRLLIDIAESEDPDAIVGPVVGLGPGRIPLDRVARVARPGASWYAPTPDTDLVLLTNGDRLTGFVGAIGPVVLVETDAGAVTEIPLDRVAEIRLANPPERTPGMIVTDDRGVALRPRTLGIDAAGVLQLTVDPGPLGVDSRGEDAIAYARSGARMVGLRMLTASGETARALASARPGAVRPTGDRRWTPDPRPTTADDPALALGDIHMPAPAEAVYPVDPGVRATRFASGVRATAPGPWTDCIVRVHAETRPGERVLLAEHRITRDRAHAEIAANLPAGVRAIILEVDPGRYGAVQDAVTFEAPRLLVRE
ncbi:MAG: hypothetical protein LAT64_08845 [Phycisphaerales bacterium]|nr:hypothetical protein [Planctomycetota bacterium]MCH8508857.1 hypothetical protein [Phycisphaerales bacterium]